MVNKKKILKIQIILYIHLLFYSCIDISIPSIDDDVDSGFSITIRNYTEKEYIGCKFYMGTYDENNNYIAVDSLVYPDLVIYRKTEGIDVNEENGFSTTYPFRESRKGLNEYGYWSPKKIEIKEISGNTEIVFKFELSNGVFGFTSPLDISNGSLSLIIREGGIISW